MAGNAGFSFDIKDKNKQPCKLLVSLTGLSVDFRIDKTLRGMKYKPSLLYPSS